MSLLFEMERDLIFSYNVLANLADTNLIQDYKWPSRRCSARYRRKRLFGIRWLRYYGSDAIEIKPVWLC